MKKYFLIFLILQGHAWAFHPHAVTYETPGGRLGDQLIAYMHAKWISYAYEIPLIYKPFCYSRDLILDDAEELCEATHARYYKHTLKVENLHTIEENTLPNVLFITQYFPESSYELQMAKWPIFPINWKDPQFLALLRTLIYPKTPVICTELPTDRVTVAAHVRRGGGFDDPAQYHHWPLKFPPDSFYITEIRKIYELIKQPLFVHIFTDDPMPSILAESYASALTDIDVVFDYRSEGNSYKANVLTDLFDMMRYNCLIRPESNYSIVAERLGDYTMVIHPTRCMVQGKQIVITESQIIQRLSTNGM
jgi:hypothetical protein